MQENCGTLLPLLQQIPGRENADNEDVREWMNEDEQQELTVIYYKLQIMMMQ
jgi:hypothetical protein